MKVILIGYPGSQIIVPASRYLTSKYLPKEFEITYLNYKGDINHWSTFLVGYLTALTDNHIIFALDDYLIADYLYPSFDWEAATKIMTRDKDIVCFKLCYCTEEEHKEYPVTTQWCIWDREYLISLLLKVNTPWQFEVVGSRLFDKKVLHAPCLKYFTNSSISSRWEGVRLDGLKQEDIEYIREHKLLV